MISKYVVHVFLKNPKEGQEQNYYFGSMKAIYSVLSVEDIGRTHDSLRTLSIKSNGGVFENRHCVIRIAEIVRSKQQAEQKDRASSLDLANSNS